LGVDRAAQLRFGVCPGVPLATPLKPRSKKAAPLDAFDRTEIDFVLSGCTTTLFVEAKLTESDFQAAAPALLTRYRDLEAIFDIDRLPHTSTTLRVPYSSRSDEWGTNTSTNPEPIDPDIPAGFLDTRPAAEPRIAGYQLIRNILAAYAADASFCLLLDARRRDLIDTWYAVLSAVRSLSFATRLRVLTWQDLARAVPRDLQYFLAAKYGIET
ncbi:MAG TPA: hypothetical protein VF221_22735, partial [Chloroflexota bacterium]